MAIITVPSATQGRSYSVKIAGDAPTPSEQARIAKYVTDQDASNQALVQHYFGAPAEAAPEAPQKGGIAGVLNALGRGVDVTQQGAYSALEGLGSSTGIDWLRDFGASGAEANTKQLEESQAQRTMQEDVSGIGSGASFVGETVAESVAPMGISIAGAAAAGAAAGAIATAWSGPGATIGAGAGAIIGAAGAALSQIPLFYGWNRERQKQEDVTAGRPVEVNEGTALLASIPQATTEAFQDLFIAGKFAKLFPKLAVNNGKLLTRLVKGSTAGVLTEVPTEVGQQFLERYQAGLPLFDEDALSEYEQAAIAAAAAGGAMGGGFAAIHGDQRLIDKKKKDDLKKKQISEDSEFMTANSKIAEAFAAQNTADIEAKNAQADQGQQDTTQDPRLALPAPTQGKAPKLKIAPIVNPAAYTPDMRTTALRFATERPNFSRGELHQHLNEVTKSNIPQQSIASLLGDMKNEGLLRQAGNKVKATKGAVQSRQRIDSMNNFADQLDAESKAIVEENNTLALHMRSAEQTGVDLTGKKADPSVIGRRIDQNTSRIGQNTENAAKARESARQHPENIATSPVERIGLPPGQKAAPLSQATPAAVVGRQEAIVQTMANNANARKQLEIKQKSLSGRKLSSMEQVALDDTKRKLEVLKAQQLELMAQHKSPEAAIQDAQNQEAADNAKALEAQAQATAKAQATEQARLQTMGVAQPATTMAPTFSAKAQNVFGSLRQYLNKMNLGNIKLAGENSLTGNEGLYDPQLRLMTLAMGIYDPKLSENELFDRLARVMDHEAIHALKSLGKFSEAEWASLTRAASTMKYKTMRNGKLVEREYTYLDRAESMYNETIARENWASSTIALDLLSPQVLKALRKAASKSKVKLGDTVNLDLVATLIGEQTATQVAQIEFAAEEAVAEMFRDYVGGRVQFVGKPKLLFERIKDFFRALIGASVKSGITDAQSILDSIKSGDVGARPDTIAPQAAQTAAQPVARPVAPQPAPVAPTPAAAATAPVAAADTASMTQDQYADHLKSNGLPDGVSSYDALTARPENRNLTQKERVALAASESVRSQRYNQMMFDLKVRDIDGVKQNSGSAGWEHFTVGTDTHQRGTDRHKSYVTLNDAVDVTESDIRGLLSALSDAGYNGQVKFPEIGTRAILGFDNIVMHGATKAEAEFGLKVASQYFGNRVSGTQMGVDTNGQSHSERISKEIEAVLKAKKANQAPAARQSKTTSDIVRQSRMAAQRADSDPNFTEWANDDGFVLRDDDGIPQVYYTGTSKDFDFKSFKIAGHGGWFTKDPEEASGYAETNDSQGYKQEGWKLIPTNTSSRVLPVFIKVVNPYTGEYGGKRTGNYKKEQTDWFNSLRRQGYDSWIPEGKDYNGDLVVVLEKPSQIKSVFASGYDGKDKLSRYSKMTADQAYKARDKAYGERASIMGGISKFLTGGVNPPTKAEIEAWIKQSDTRFQDDPRVRAKSIDTPEFKFWFGKSLLVVTDQYGREIPRRVFHGGFSGDIYEFDFSKIGPYELGFHVGTAEQANEFALGMARDNFKDGGAMYPLYARIENPVRLKDLGSWTAENIFPQMFDMGLITQEQAKRFMVAARTGATNSQEKIRNILQSLGYDGVVYLNRYEGFSEADMKKAQAFAKQNGTTVNFFTNNLPEERLRQFFPSAQDSYILLKPTQLKSAVGNNGEYSTLNKDIRYSTLVPKKGTENGTEITSAQEAGTGRSFEGLYGEEQTAAKAGADTAGSRASKLPVTPEELTSPDTNFMDFLKRPGWVIMSGTDTTYDPEWRDRHNAMMEARLREELKKLDVPFIEVYGEYLGKSDGVSFMTIMDPEQARRIASRYNQDSVITANGLIYVREVPPTLSTGDVVFDDEARIQDGFTYIPDRNLTFSLILDGDTWPGTPVIPDGYEEVEGRKQLPVKDGKVRLLHWSPKILTELDPKYANKREGPKANWIGAERNDQHKKVFFGINPRESGRQPGTGYIKENLGENMHEAFVDPMQLYPWFQDPDGLWTGKTKIKELNQYERNDYEGRIIKAGYLGSYVTEDGDRRFDNKSFAPLGNVASIYYPIKVSHVTRERQSRMAAKVQPVSNVPNKLKRLTVLDMMDPVTGMYIQREGKKITVIDALHELFNRRSDVVINSDDPGAVNRMADLIALEAQMAILRNPGAIGWYGETLAMAKRVAAIMYPEISKVNPYTGEPSNSYVAMNEHIWDLATAITSNGQAVLDNFTHAAEQYEYWKIHGRFKPVGYGKQSTGIVAGLKFYNSMRDVGYSDEQVQDFLNQKMPVSELKKHPVVKALGIKIGSSEKATTEVYGSYVLGPKIGQGFYQNLRGNFTPLTMDIWFNRLFNRISGKPFAIVTDKTRLANFERISGLIDNPMITEYERSLLNTAKEVTSIDVVTPANVGDLAIAYDKLFQRDYTNTKTREMKRLVALGYDPKADETKALANAARPVKTELIQAMGTASQNFKVTEQAAPRGGGERAFMRDVIDRAQTKVLKATGLEVNTADFQALLWYAEKQLFKAMNIREGRGGDNDYVDGVIHFLRSRNVSDEEIKRVLPADQRDRLVSGTDSGRSNASILSGTEASDPGQADSSNQLLSAKPNGDSEATVARNGGVGRRAKPKRGTEAVAAAKKEDPVRLSRMTAHTPMGIPTPYTGPSDLMKHSESLRYAAVQDALSRLIQRTVGKYFKIDPKIIDDKTANFFKKMQDDMIHVGKLYDNLRAKGISIPQEYDTYFQDQLMRDTAGAKKQDFQEGIFRKIVETAVGAKFDRTNITSLEAAVKSAIGTSGYITEIVNKVGNESHAIANAYIYALHAKERNQRIKEMSKGKDTKGSGMSDAELEAILKWKDTLPQSQQAALEEVDNLAQDIVWMTNDEYIQGGLIPHYQDNKATLDDGTEVEFPQYDHYVSLRGFTDPEADEDVSEGGGAAIAGGGKFGGSKPTKSATGRVSYAGDILVNIGTQYEAAVDKAARNKVGLSFLNLLEKGGTDLSAIAEVWKSHPLKKVVVNGTIRTVPSRDFGVDDLAILPVRRNGKEILIGFHDLDIANAMKGPVGTSGSKPVMNAIHNITRLYANLLTSWNPAFVLSNLPRDIETAIFNSQQYNMKGASGSIIKKVGPSIKAIWGVINDTGAGDPHLRMRYRQFYENGGQSVFSGMVTLSNSMKNVKGIINEVEGLASGNALFKSKHFFTKTLLGKIENANTAVENGTRLAFFDAMMNELESQGVPTKIAAKRAAYAAKNLTTNFTKGGEFRNGLNTFYLFYNASLQGSMAMMNSLVRSKNARKMAASIVIMGFAMDMLNAAASDDEDKDGILDYDNFNENRLKNYILIPDFTGTGTHISIPMAYGLNIFYNTGRTLSNFLRGVGGAKGTYTASEAAASTIGTAFSTLNPFGGNNMMSIASPTQTDLIVELMTNKDFKDQPIYKELSPFDQSKSRSNLYWSTTSPSAIWLSKFINDDIGGGTDIIPGEILGQRLDIQPDVLEHVLGFVTGGLGTFLGSTLDTATSTVPDALAGRWSADMIGKTPVLNKFLTQVSEKDKSGDYYENRDKVMVIQAEIKDAIASGDRDRIAAAKATYPERIKVMGRIAEIERRLAKLRKMKKLVTESNKMPEDKRQKSIDNINQAINKLMSIGNQIMGDAGI